jgi:hypothetical protein
LGNVPLPFHQNLTVPILTNPYGSNCESLASQK